MKVSHYWQLRSLHPLSNWSSRHDTTGLKLLSFAFLGSTSQRGHNGRTIHCARGQLTDHFWGNQWSWSSSSIDERHYDGLLRHTSQGWLAAEQKARELPETQISSTLAQVCIILSICSVTAMGLHITLRISFSSFFPPGNLFFITSSSCWGPSSWPSRHGNLLVGMQFYKLCGKW